MNPTPDILTQALASLKHLHTLHGPCDGHTCPHARVIGELEKLVDPGAADERERRRKAIQKMQQDLTNQEVRELCQPPSVASTLSHDSQILADALPRFADPRRRAPACGVGKERGMKSKPERVKANTVLPKGARSIEPAKHAVIGAWKPQFFDAKVERHGITWYRVQNGMGGRNDREDWCADVPGVCIAVHDYHYNGEEFGANHGTFDNACLQEARIHLRQAKKEREKKLVELKAINKALAILEKL